VATTREWLAAFRRSSYLASVDLAREKGPFPLFDRDAYGAGAFVRTLDPDVQDAIRTHGIRNALLTSIAPTGTISLFAENVSSGIEPIFAYSFTRRILEPDGSHREEQVTDYAVGLYRAMQGEKASLPDAFVDTQALSPAEHVAMQAAVQPFIDSSISKTINLPADIAFEAFKDVYALAYESGCKGCTTYRPNAVTGSVLVAVPADESPGKGTAEAASPDGADLDGADPNAAYGAPPSRPDSLPGSTYKLKWADSEHAIYVTVNDIVEDGRRRPFEVFINSKNMEHYAWTVALTRMISAVFRRGGDVRFVVEELKAVFDPRGGQWMNGRYVPSLLAAIGGVIERHMAEIGFVPAAAPSAGAAPEAVPPPARPSADAGASLLGQCPRCGQPALIHQEGCDLCSSCGYSRCG
jgi:ribonucleoside-diphosphate reductase alpha chain